MLAARQELIELDAVTPTDERNGRVGRTAERVERLRQATFELYPAVLERWVGAGGKQLAASTARRVRVSRSPPILITQYVVDRPSFSAVWFANCCPTSCGIPELPPPGQLGITDENAF